MEEKSSCQFFDVCAAYIIREKIKEIRRVTSKGFHERKWSEQFCFGDNPEKCVHFEERKEFERKKL